MIHNSFINSNNPPVNENFIKNIIFIYRVHFLFHIFILFVYIMHTYPNYNNLNTLHALDNFYKWYDQEIFYLNTLLQRIKTHKSSNHTTSHTTSDTTHTNYIQYIQRLSFLLYSIEQFYLTLHHPHQQHRDLIILINNIKILIHYIKYLYLQYPSFL